MSIDGSRSSSDTVRAKEVYPLQGSSESRSLRTRSVLDQARFFVPRLRQGMSLLDCGCGPGTITCGLAEFVAPGEVVGIDIRSQAIDAAQAMAAEQGLSNLRFEVASVYEIPFPDATFDAVFSHALLEHLSEPHEAVKEMYRVLRAGGCIGLRVPDYGGNLMAPPDPQVDRFWDLYERLSLHKGGNPRAGRSLRTLLREAGFSEIESSASYDIWSKEHFRYSENAPFSDQLLELDWVSRAEWKEIADAASKWQDDPDYFDARAFCEAIGTKQ